VTWWVWTLVWVVLVAGALGVLFLVGRSLFRKGMALAGELGQASERLSAVAEELQTLSDTRTADEPAVFADPTRLRQERFLARKARPTGDRARLRGGDSSSRASRTRRGT
jgi:hypothetical protein